MQVIHGHWLRVTSSAGLRAEATGGLVLWAEDSGSPQTAPRRRGRPARVQPHPYAVDAEALRSLIGETSELDPRATTVELVLPTRGAAPLASPELIRDKVADVAGELRDGRWQIPGLLLGADDAYRYLRGLDPSTPTYGASIHHLIELVAFAASLMVRGRVLPTATVEPPTATWRPVLTGPDAAWARVLAAAAPPSLIAAPPVAPAGVDDPVETWADALEALVDAACRAALSRTELRPGRRGSVVTRAWLSALTGAERSFRADSAALQTLRADLADWQADALGGPVRACFRLSEPPTEDVDAVDSVAGWQLRFGLQSTEEQSLVVDADQVWSSPSTLPGLGQPLDAPQETLLAELGKAARLYPTIDRSLRTARPLGLALDTTEAHEFLSRAAPTLATAGFGIQLPGWWSRPARLGVRISASTPSQPGVVDGVTSGVGFDAIADFRYDLALGESRLTADELAELSATKSPLVRIRGQWVQLEARQLQAGLRLIGRSGQLSVGELLRLGVGVGESVEELPVTGIEADGWLGDLLSGRADERLALVATPGDFTGELRPYQTRGLSWLDFLGRLGIGGILADDMGLGKTVQLLALLAGDQQDDHDHQPSLLVCPMSLVGNWQREATRFTPQLRVHIHHGAERARGQAFAAAVRSADLVITTYALAARDAAALRKISWRRVIVDEAQAIKNAATKQASAIRSIPASTRIAVTGTPVENRLADLWSILEFANPGMLGSAQAFKQRYAEPIERHGDDDAAERLRRFTSPFVLRRLKTDTSIIADLPDKIEMEVACNLTAEQAALYRAVVDDMLDKINNAAGIERRGLVLATMTKLKQVCNHPAQYLRDGSALAGRSGKLDRLDDVVEEILLSGERALLFTQYAEFGAMLRGHLTGRFGREVLFLHGGVPKAERDDMVARFQADDTWAPPLFVLSLKAGGTGLTLTAANHVIHVDRWWNPAVEDQATDRAFRIGQRRNVQVRKFVCAGTVEEKIATMITEKRDLAARIVGSGENWLTELSTGQLADLLRLESGAVVE